MPDILITEMMDRRAVDELCKDFDAVYDKNLVDNRERLKALLPGCRALIVRNRTQVNASLLDAGKDLVIIGRLGVGLDNIDVPLCEERGIRVAPATGANSISVAEYVMGGILLFARLSAYQGTLKVIAGDWPREAQIGGEIAGKTLGLAGFGSIAREVAVRARAFGLNILGHDPFIPDDASLWREYNAKPVALETLLADSDIVSLHMPLTPQTRNLLNASLLRLMRKDALLINTARGDIVDEAALAAALKNGHIGGALLDVFAKEPFTPDSPLAQAPNCILTAHIAGVTHASNRRISSVTAHNVRRALLACEAPRK